MVPSARAVGSIPTRYVKRVLSRWRRGHWPRCSARSAAHPRHLASHIPLALVRWYTTRAAAARCPPHGMPGGGSCRGSSDQELAKTSGGARSFVGLIAWYSVAVLHHVLHPLP
eukprot:771871-Pyramimonas_sp.AAC.1